MPTRLLICVAVALLLVACTRSREIETDLRLVDVETGWYDAGVEGGLNKLVPSVTLRIENVSDRDIDSVQLLAIFRREGDPRAWGDLLLEGIDRDGLAAGATGDPLVIRSRLGYTGEDARQTMMESPHFVDVTIDVMGKHGPRTWVKLGEFPVERRVLTD